MSKNGTDQGDMFDMRGMVRIPDHSTSVDAAAHLLPKLNDLQIKVLSAIRAQPEICDTELEELPQFDGYGPSTIRKRRSELCQQERVVVVGVKRNANGRKQNTYKVNDQPTED